MNWRQLFSLENNILALLAAFGAFMHAYVPHAFWGMVLVCIAKIRLDVDMIDWHSSRIEHKLIDIDYGLKRLVFALERKEFK